MGEWFCAFACGRSCGGGVAWCLNAGVTTFWLCVSGSVSLAEVKPSASPVDWSGHQVLSCCCEGVGGGNICVALHVAGAGAGGGCTPSPGSTSSELSLPPPCACASGGASGPESAFLTILVVNLVIVAFTITGGTLPANPG